MATAPLFETESSASNSIVVAVTQNPAIVLVDQAKRDDLFAHIRREVEAFEPDLTTNKGREAIKSFAFKITRTKTAIDDAGKKLNEEARAKIGVVDAARRDARETLDAMAKAVRAPLTEWEEAEKARIEWCRTVIADLKAGAVVMLEDTSDSVRKRGEAAWNVLLSADTFGDMLDEAQQAKDATVATLKTALARLTKEEADRAELEKLRAAEAERLAREQAEREAAEAQARADAEAKAAEDRRVAEKAAEAERVERVRLEAAGAAQKEEQRKADEARAAMQAEHEKALQAERDRAAEIERAAQAERDRVAREAEEQAKRDRDQKHKTAVMKAAKEAIMTCGADEETAKKIVLLIRSGDVPNVSLRF